jgi:AcrR family transcriptional regulator
MGKKSITKRQSQAMVTKERIYSAAIDLMDREGFENITIADISKQAGVSVGAFYHYFISKNDLLAEIFHKVDEYFSTQVISALKRANSPEMIVEYFDYYAKFNISSGVDMTQQLFNPKIKFFIEKDRPMLTLLEDIIRQGQQKKEIRADETPQELARLLFVMARGIVFDWSVYDGGYDLEDQMHRYIECLVSTLKI